MDKIHHFVASQTKLNVSYFLESQTRLQTKKCLLWPFLHFVSFFLDFLCIMNNHCKTCEYYYSSKKEKEKLLHYLLNLSFKKRIYLVAFKHHSNQSHYREVPRWGVSNGARHNWKCFLAYKKLSYTFDKSKCATNYRDIFEVYDGFIGQKIVKLWRQESRPFGPNPAQISIPVPWKSPTVGLLYNDFVSDFKPPLNWLTQKLRYLFLMDSSRGLR